MKEILEYLQQLWIQAGYPEIAGYLATLAASLGILSYLWKSLGVRLWRFRQQRRLNRDLHPFYTSVEIECATQYYVETKCQNIPPSKEDEPRRTHAFAAKENIIPFFLEKAFKSDQDEYQFYIVLADSGMGKTTFLINLYLRYMNQFFKPKYQIKLFPLGFPEIDKEIEKISDKDKRNTILLLDAFDEDIQAVDDYKTRLDEIIQKVLHFREVVITCRTQFFPSEEEEPKEVGDLRYYGVDGGVRVFRKLYLSPFDDKDIRSYLRKRFSWFQVDKKRKAYQIVEYSPNLMVRPMLLSYIEDLLQSESPYTSTYMVYAELIQKWVEREVHKVPPDRHKDYKEELWRFSREIAVDIYRHRADRKGSLLIPGEAIKPFAEKHEINLKEMEMKARSLLNRNARGDYKFSHKSVLEYFLAEEALFNPAFRKELHFEGMDQAEVFFDEMIWDKLTVPFFSRSDVKGEYSLKDGKPKALAKINVKSLPEVTHLVLTEWNPSDDLLLLKGLKKLEKLDVTKLQITPNQRNELQYALPECTLGLFRPLRIKAVTVSKKKFKKMFGLHENQRPLEYIQNGYKDKGEVVVDHATGLMWQKAGSRDSLTHEKALEYVQELNQEKFADYNNWRLPTIPELMSLLEPEKQSNGLYINPIFDKPEGYPWYWSADRLPESEGGSSGAAWSVDFLYGRVYLPYVSGEYYVRCVRSRQEN